jgi:hypothetical protein
MTRNLKGTSFRCPNLKAVQPDSEHSDFQVKLEVQASSCIAVARLGLDSESEHEGWQCSECLSSFNLN